MVELRLEDHTDVIQPPIFWGAHLLLPSGERSASPPLHPRAITDAGQ
jgi:hypothetical protein